MARDEGRVAKIKSECAKNITNSDEPFIPLRLEKKKKLLRTWLIFGSLSVAMLTAAGITTGVLLSSPQYIEFTVSGSDNLTINGEEKSGKVSYKNGDTIKLETKEVEGYEFQGWFLNGEKIEDEYVYEFTLNFHTKGDYEAVFEAINYTLTYADEITELRVNNKKANTANIGDNITFKIEDKTSIGQQISRVYYEYPSVKYDIAKDEGRYLFTMPANDIEVCVQYGNILYSLTKNTPQHGSVKLLKDDSEVSTACYGDKIEILVQPDAGYKISKVAIFSNGTESEIFLQNNKYLYTIPNQDVEFKIEFEKERYNITSTEIACPKTSLFDEEVSFNSPNKEGYLVKRIYYKISENEVEIQTIDGVYFFNMPAGDIEIFVEYQINKYSITKVVMLGSERQADTDKYILDFDGTGIYQSQTTFKVKEIQGYEIQVKCNEISLIDDYTFTMPAENVTIEVKYLPISYSSTCSNSVNGSFKLAGSGMGSAKFGSTLEVVCNPDDNCIIEEVYYTFEQDQDTKHAIKCIENRYIFTQPAGDISVHVVFKKLLTETIFDEIKYSLNSKTMEATMLSKTDKFTSQILTAPNTVREDNFDYKVTKISENIFENFYTLKKIDMSNAEYLTTIEKFAFNNCMEVTEVLFPTSGSILEIGKYAFAGLIKIKNLDLSKQTSLEKISEGLFQKTGIENISLPTSIKYFSSYAFSDCERLLSLTIPENTISLNSNIFKSQSEGMKHLVEIFNLSRSEDVKANLEIAVENILNSNGNIQVLSSTNSRITKTKAKISNKTISEGEGDAGEFIWLTTETNDKVLVGFYPSNSISNLKYSLILPEKDFTYSLMKNFYTKDTNLTKIYLPKSLTKIEKYAFENCNNLTSVEMNGNPIIEDYAFSSTLGKLTIYFENSQAYTSFTTLPSSISSISISILVNKTIIDDEGEYNDLFEVIDEIGDYYIVAEM